MSTARTSPRKIHPYAPFITRHRSLSPPLDIDIGFNSTPLPSSSGMFLLIHNVLPSSDKRAGFGNETVIFPFTKTPPTLNFKLLLANHRAPLARRLINNTRHHPSAIHISPLPSSMSQKASIAIPGRRGGAIVPQTSLSVNARVTPTLSGILQNAVIVS